MKYEMTIKEACYAGFWSCLGPTDWIQLVAIVISLISVVIALFVGIAGWKSAKASEKSANLAREQLNLINEQRKDAVRPELFFEKESFGLSYSQEMDYGRFNTKNNILNLTMTNTGNGHAKRIKFEWDFEKLSSSVELIEENQTEIQYILEYKEGSHIYVNRSGYTFLDLDFEQEMPMLSADKNCEIHLPFSYMQILTIVIHLCFTKKLSLELIPDLKLSLMYADALGNQCSQKFIFTPHVIPRSSTESSTKVFNYEIDVIMKTNEVL
ncbi:hypothetical protein ACT7DM_29400 [Bacillus cereus]